MVCKLALEVSVFVTIAATDSPEQFEGERNNIPIFPIDSVAHDIGMEIENPKELLVYVVEQH
jgi:hypothetical protein